MADLHTRLSLHTIEAMTDGVIWLEESGAFFWANSAAGEALGYSREELSRLTVFDLNPDMTPERWTDHWRRNRAERSIVETRHRRKDGTVFPVEIINHFIDFDHHTYSCSIIRDSSERKQRKMELEGYDRRLRESERQLRLSHFTIEQIGDAVLWISRDGRIRHANREAWRRLGYTYEELTALTIFDINRTFDPDRLNEAFLRMQREGAFVVESTHYHQNGKEIPVEISANYIAFEGEEYTCSIIRDITERRRKEAALRGALLEIRELKERLEEENNYLQQEIKVDHNFGEIITQSAAFKKALRQVEQVADTPTTVMIIGESGTGKELIARSLHQLSSRNDRPMIKVNCAALPAHLIESELFGHEKGAFTGAIARKKGRFELAHGGTLFLDEIGEMPPPLQPKLLRVLQEGEFERLGGQETLRVDVRIIAATNRDLAAEIRAGRFREDLYYRLNVFPIRCLSLRERKEDIPLLVGHFCKKFEKRSRRRITNIPQKVLNRLAEYDFPGNIRELENIIERAVILSPGEKLQIGDWLPKKKEVPLQDHIPSLDEMQRAHIVKVLKLTNWRVSGDKGAARILGLPPTTLESRMKKFDIRRSNDAL